MEQGESQFGTSGYNSSTEVSAINVCFSVMSQNCKTALRTTVATVRFAQP